MHRQAWGEWTRVWVNWGLSQAHQCWPPLCEPPCFLEVFRFGSMEGWTAGTIAKGRFSEKMWRTCTRWVFGCAVQLPLIFTSKITSLSLVSSDHQLWGIPSTNSSDVWNSSWCTATSVTWSGAIMPAAGVTYTNLEGFKFPPETITNGDMRMRDVPEAILENQARL